MTDIELLAPAGDINKLDIALEYGADAVYLAGKVLGMRAACKNFDYDGLKTASLATHSRKKKFYVALNIFPNDDDFACVDEYVNYLESIHADGLIVSDLGLIEYIKALGCNVPIHVSTQANIMNSQTAKAYAALGVKRIVLARELSMTQIRKMRDAVSDEVEFEAFVHGAMCVSYSGRCLISNYLSGRSANRGECNQACRMRFTPENTNASLEMTEDDGTYIFGGNDLNMIEHLKEIADAGVTSLKIEGRVKSEYYVACVVNAYRHAIDDMKKGKPFDPVYLAETYKAPNRGFNTGFYYGQPVHDPNPQKYYDFCGLVVKNTERGAVVEMRNRFKTGDKLEVLSRDNKHLNKILTVPQMQNEKGEIVDDAKVPATRYLLMGESLPEMSVLRRPQK